MGLLFYNALFVLLVSTHFCCANNTEKNFFKKIQASPSFKLGCILEHCVPEFVSCELSKECRDGISCSEVCFGEWDKDTTPEKFHVQNCTNKCAFTYGEEKAFKGMMACLTDHVCWSFPEIPKTCKAPNVHPIKPLSLADIQGHWWVIRGYHPVYDCYPCQQLFFEPINKTAWSYTPRYQAYKTDGTLYYVTNQKWVMPQTTPGAKIPFTYHDVGMDHYETWWLIDKADDSSYAQMYYCGNTLQWNYEGALVFAKNRTLSDDDYTKIAAAYKQAVGLDLQQFCYARTAESCPT